jgi:magnesium-protoporphyrin O-methyltransferase
VSGCCQPGDLDDIFTSDRARADARDYRRKGVRGQARAIVELARQTAREGSVLEIGGGVGAIQVELLRAGAARALNVELSRSYEAAARELGEEAGVADRVERKIGDFVAEAADIPPADVVVLHRGVCCYPDAAALADRAAGHARTLLLLTMPVERWWMRLAAIAINLWPAITGSRFRFHVHPSATVTAAASAHGLRLTERRHGWIWQLLVFAR